MYRPEMSISCSAAFSKFLASRASQKREAESWATSYVKIALRLLRPSPVRAARVETSSFLIMSVRRGGRARNS